MQIHTTEEGQTIKEISKIYTVDEELIRAVNKIEGKPTVGEEILILTPSRSYRVQYGDTADKISLRFGTRESVLAAMNPHVSTEKLQQGEILTIKYSDIPLGASVANGYFYKGCSKSDLERAMPYLTYVTFASAVADRRGIHRTANDNDYVYEVIKRGKLPLLRVHDKTKERFRDSGDSDDFIRELIRLAQEGDYRGIVLNACNLECSAEEYSRFLINVRKQMIGCDLILITEVNENSPIEFSEYADASVLYYPKFAMSNPPSFADGEERVLSGFACRGESARAFVDIPSLAVCKNNFSGIEDALKKARMSGKRVYTNESTLLSHFSNEEQGDCCFSSLRLIKGLFKLISDYGYMGICFDIMNTPTSFLQMYNALFKSSCFAYLRTQGEYNREA